MSAINSRITFQVTTKKPDSGSAVVKFRKKAIVIKSDFQKIEDLQWVILWGFFSSNLSQKNSYSILQSKVKISFP